MRHADAIELPDTDCELSRRPNLSPRNWDEAGVIIGKWMAIDDFRKHLQISHAMASRSTRDFDRHLTRGSRSHSSLRYSFRTRSDGIESIESGWSSDRATNVR